MRNGEKKPLYRKVNARARGVHHNHGDDYKNSRNKKGAFGMRKGIQRGLDYTPLFKFLISKVGENWNDVHSEAVSRLDKQEPISWLVFQDYESAEDVVRLGESSYYSGLYVDPSGILRVVNPKINEESLEPSCHCCTHSFNGIPFTKKFGEFK